METLLAEVGGWGSIGLSGIVTFTIISLIRGWLVPRSILRSAEAREEKMWQAWQTSEKAREGQTIVNAELLELGRTSVEILRAVKTPRSGNNR